MKINHEKKKKRNILSLPQVFGLSAYDINIIP